MRRYVITYHRVPLADSASWLCYSMVIGLIALVVMITDIYFLFFLFFLSLIPPLALHSSFSPTILPSLLSKCA